MKDNFDEEETTKKKTEAQYLQEALENADPDLKAWVKYNALGVKQKDGVKLTKEETEFLEAMNQAYAIEQARQEKVQRELEADQANKDKIKEQFEKAKLEEPYKIDYHRDNQKLVGGDSIPKLLKFAFTLKKAKKKGGRILIKITRQKNVSFEWTMKDINFVEFYNKDEKGNVIPEITRVTKIDYNYEGSPIPVLFAVQGYYENWDFYNEFRKDITSEMMARIASRSRHAGYLEGINQREDSKPKNPLEGILMYLPLIIVVVCLIMLWLVYSMYGEMQQMVIVVDSLKNSVPTGAMVVQ